MRRCELLRRGRLALSLTSAVLVLAASTSAASSLTNDATPTVIPVTGAPVAPSMRAWISAAQAVMRSYHLPGASLAVAFDGRVVLEDGLGYADLATRTPAGPNSIYRLASVSKPITATVIGLLVNEHRLSLSTRPFATVLSGLRGPGAASPLDPRLRDITIGDLLVHAGGWDLSDLGFDPIFDASPEEQALGLHAPPSCEAAIRYMLGIRLSFTPGTNSVYSNFGYCVLADTIAHVTHESYARAVATMLLRPLHMLQTVPSPANPASLLPGEVHFYGQGPEASGPESPSEVSLLAGEGAANWTSTASDLERFLIATSATEPGSEPFPTWPAATIAGEQIEGTSPYPSVQNSEVSDEGTTWYFDGSLPGTSTEIAMFGPVTYVMLTNSRNPANFTDFAALRALAQRERTLSATAWPTGNLLVPSAVVHRAPA